MFANVSKTAHFVVWNNYAQLPLGIDNECILLCKFCRYFFSPPTDDG